MRVVFLGSVYPPEMPHFVRGLREVSADVLGVGDTPREHLPGRLKANLTDYLQVPRLMDEPDVVERVTAWQRGQTVDKVWTNWEPLVLAAAELRERFGIEGMDADTANGFRDKQVMKERIAAAGLRVPRSHRAQTTDGAREAAEDVGFPLVLKPIAGAGSADTYVCRDAAELEQVLAKTGHVREVSVEEYIEGEEFTYDTVCVGGEPVYENVAQYLPKPIEARSNEWISPVIITVRDLQQAKIQKGIALGRQVMKALGMDDGFTHMEWFYTPKGEAVFGEIGSRPGGARLVDQMNYTSDIDLFREWARVACYRRFEAPTERKYNCGIIFKRAQGQGRITAIHGLRDYMARFGQHVVEDELLRPGEHRRNWLHTLVSDGYLIVRHPDWEEAKRISFAAATDITMLAGG